VITRSIRSPQANEIQVVIGLHAGDLATLADPDQYLAVATEKGDVMVKVVVFVSGKTDEDLNEAFLKLIGAAA
jgi:hypothetical protein